MVETNYGKCGHLLVNWGFRKINSLQRKAGLKVAPL
jgi:hypothetical protein